jgi:hypothetical protein
MRKLDPNMRDRRYYTSAVKNIEHSKIEADFATLRSDMETPEAYIDMLHTNLHRIYSNIGGDFATLMTYPAKDANVGHAVVVWYTGESIYIIDPQLFVYYGTKHIYSLSDSSDTRLTLYDEKIKTNKLLNYIRKNVDLNSWHRHTHILTALHSTYDKASLL